MLNSLMFGSLNLSLLNLGLGLAAGLLGLSMYGLVTFFSLQQKSLKQAPQLPPLSQLPLSLPRISVIVPAYNEAANIHDCVTAVLASQLPNPAVLQVLVADDESTDQTQAIAQAVAAQDARVQVIAVPPRPTDALWRGKNWACAQAVQQATGDYWLFIDADVRLTPKAIATAVSKAEHAEIDLLTLMPNIICGCLAEWLVQPVMRSILAVGFSFEGVNDLAEPDRAFAAGPFMLFRRNTYTAIGGHRAVADDLVEDVALARQIKRQGYRLHYALGPGLLQVRMYQTWAALWEGWTKNYYLALNCNPAETLYSAASMVVVFSFPWLGAALAVGLIALGLAAALPFSVELAVVTLLLGGGAIALQYYYRFQTARQFQQPLRYGWLGWLSGLLMAAIAIGSMIKTETGWGWTWRGRPLAIKR